MLIATVFTWVSSLRKLSCYLFWYVTLLVFRRKDLCDARPKPEVSSKNADEPTPLIEPRTTEPDYTE